MPRWKCFKELKRGTNCPARVRSLEEFTTVCYTLNQAVTDSIHASIKIRLIRPRWRRSITAVTKDTCAVRADVTGGSSVVMTAQRDEDWDNGEHTGGVDHFLDDAYSLIIITKTRRYSKQRPECVCSGELYECWALPKHLHPSWGPANQKRLDATFFFLLTCLGGGI